MRKWEQFTKEELEWLMYDRLMVTGNDDADRKMAKEIEEELNIRGEEEG